MTNLCRKRRTDRVSRTHPDDGIDSKNANTNIGDVHRTACAFVGPGRVAVKLSHHAVNFNTLGDAVAVTTVRGGDQIRRFQRPWVMEVAQGNFVAPMPRAFLWFVRAGQTPRRVSLPVRLPPHGRRYLAGNFPIRTQTSVARTATRCAKGRNCKIQQSNRQRSVSLYHCQKIGLLLWACSRRRTARQSSMHPRQRRTALLLVDPLIR